MDSLSVNKKKFMNPIYHDLRSYRKKTCLTQQDVALLFGNKDVSQISRYETCPINPQVEISLLYHLLFNVPMTSFFAQQKEAIHKKLLQRIPNIINEFKAVQSTPLIEEKIEFLSKLLENLTNRSV